MSSTPTDVATLTVDPAAALAINANADTPDVCLCGAAYFGGYYLNTVKRSHLEAFGINPDADAPAATGTVAADRALISDAMAPVPTEAVTLF